MSVIFKVHSHKSDSESHQCFSEISDSNKFFFFNFDESEKDYSLTKPWSPCKKSCPRNFWQMCLY